MKERSMFNTGVLSIKDNVMKIGGTTINLSNIGTMNTFPFEKHSYFSGLKTWLGGLLFVIILAAIFKNLSIIDDIYIFTIIPLMIYNFKEHQKNFYGLKIEIHSRRYYIIKSNDNEFIEDVNEAISEAMRNKNASYTINLDNHQIINNGIINKGNKNKNKIINNKVKKSNGK